jgi:hypothetical protein
MTNGGHIHDKFFMMGTNGTVNMDVFSNIPEEIGYPSMTLTAFGGFN